MTLAGQAAVAIENALLYEQTRRRADALASLHEISTSMSATLDPDSALELVSRSMMQVVGGQKSTIHLVDQDRGYLYLARASNITESLADSIQKIPLDDRQRTRAFHEQSPVLVQNIETAANASSFIDQLREEKVYAFIDLPLITPSGTIGLASVYFAEPQLFRPDQIDLLRTFAAQAALAVANARAHAETDQELKLRVEQLYMLETAGRRMAAILDPDELHGTILEYALSVAAAEVGILSIYDPQYSALRIVSSQGKHQGILGEQDGMLPVEEGLLGDVFHTGEILNLSNAQLRDAHEPWMEETTSSLACVPLLRWGQRIGLLAVESPSADAFSEEHEQALRQIAAQASIALTNSNLYQQLEARLREQSLLYQASVHLGAKLEAESVVMATADSLALALSSDRVHIFRWRQESRGLELAASVEKGRPAQVGDHIRVSMSEAPGLARCLKDGAPVQWSAGDAPTVPDRSYLEEARQAGSLLAIPLRLGEENLGLVEILSDEPRRFDENEIRTAQTISSQAAIALQNSELFVHLRENHDQLMAVLNSTQSGMLMVDNAGKIVVTNHQLEVLTGLPSNDLVGKDLHDPGTKLASKLGYRPGELANLMAALRSGEPLSQDATTFEISAPDQRSLQRIESPVVDSNQHPIGWLVVLRDISEERNLQRTREQLTEMIVHDLRSPLTTILGSVTLLEKSIPDDRSRVISQALAISHRSCEQMLGLVNSLLDIAKLESGEFTLSWSQVSLGALCEQLLNTYVQEANEQGILLEHHISPTLPQIDGDEEKLRRVMGNILDNALKFTPPGGRIRMQIQEDTTHVQISVSDSGPGVPDDMKQAIFERFVQGAEGHRHGTGLGLAFSKLAVEAHGGRIWVEDNEAGGSDFRIRLPMKPPASA